MPPMTRLAIAMPRPPRFCTRLMMPSTPCRQAEDEAARRAVYRIFGEFLLERVATEGGFELAQGVERIHVAECG